MVGLARVDDRDPIAPLVEGDRKRHPVGAGGLQHHQGRGRRGRRGLDAALQGGEARRGLLAGQWHA